jgi:hypothetical protein
MTTFTSNTQSLNKAKEISNKAVFFTNEGLEINLLKSEKEECNEIVSNLKNVFSDVSVKGTTHKVIKINYTSKNKKGLKITSITY